MSVSHFYTKIHEIIFLYKGGLLHLTVVEVPTHWDIILLFWSYEVTIHHGRSMRESKTDYVMNEKARSKEKGQDPTIPFKSIPQQLRTPTMTHIPNIPLSPNNATLGTNPLTNRLLGDIQYQLFH